MHSKKPDEPSPSSRIFSLLKNLFNYKSRLHQDPLYNALRDLQSHSKQISLKERHLLSNFLQFCSKTVDEVMIPRSDICAVHIDVTLSDLSREIIAKGHTRTLIYQDTLDNIVGFIHIKDLFEVIAVKRTFNLKKLMRKPIISAPSMKLIDLLAEMQRLRTHIAVIVDEYGGTDGIATIEDIMEAIVGEIEDEHDDGKEDHAFTIVSDKEIITHARVKIQELEQILALSLKNEEDDCDTIGGLILARIGRVPKRGLIVDLSSNVKAEIVEASPRKLKKIRLIISENE